MFSSHCLSCYPSGLTNVQWSLVGSIDQFSLNEGRKEESRKILSSESIETKSTLWKLQHLAGLAILRVIKYERYVEIGAWRTHPAHIHLHVYIYLHI